MTEQTVVPCDHDRSPIKNCIVCGEPCRSGSGCVMLPCGCVKSARHCIDFNERTSCEIDLETHGGFKKGQAFIWGRAKKLQDGTYLLVRKKE